MTTRLGVVMDPIQGIKAAKDSTLAMLLEAQKRGWELYYMEMGDLTLRDGQARASTRPLRVFDDTTCWFELGEPGNRPLAELDVLLMRKDPPFDMEYIYATYMLERAERDGVLVVNRAGSLRDANEKMLTAWFPECTAPSLITRRYTEIKEFMAEFQDIILKPLGEMGGASVFRVRQGDPNASVIMETITHHQSQYVMAQQFIPEIDKGDKRILLVDGEPVPYALARIPAPGETRGNLAAGGTGVGVELSERDRWICAQVAPALREMGLLFVGLDVIGDYLTEINSTSPTCIRELDAQYGLNIAGTLFDRIEHHLQQRKQDRNQ